MNVSIGGPRLQKNASKRRNLCDRSHLVMIPLPKDFKEFLQLLDLEKVEYLLVGGYAVIYYGYPRTTGDLDIWIAVKPDNASRVTAALSRFGFEKSGLSPDLFLKPDQIIRMGLPPFRIEVLTGVSGLNFDECFSQRKNTVIDGVPVSVISLADLKTNKKAAGRHKDLNDLENLPP